MDMRPSLPFIVSALSGWNFYKTWVHHYNWKAKIHKHECVLDVNKDSPNKDWIFSVSIGTIQYIYSTLVVTFHM